MHRLPVVCVPICRAQEKAQQQVVKYFVMLTKGCGNEDCVNSNCASYKRAHGTPESIPPPNEAAMSALRLLREKEKLCGENKSISEETVNGRRRWVGNSTPSGPRLSSESGPIVGGVEADHSEMGNTANMDIAQQQDGHHVEEGMEMSPAQQVVEAIQETKGGESVMVGTIERQGEQPSSKAVDPGEWRDRCMHRLT